MDSVAFIRSKMGMRNSHGQAPPMRGTHKLLPRPDLPLRKPITHPVRGWGADVTLERALAREKGFIK